jgi:hypothetical protein
MDVLFGEPATEGRPTGIWKDLLDLKGGADALKCMSSAHVKGVVAQWPPFHAREVALERVRAFRLSARVERAATDRRQVGISWTARRYRSV